MRRSGMAFKTKTTIEAIRLAPDGTKSLLLKGGERLEGFDEVLCAVGREPLTADLNVNSAGKLLNINGNPGKSLTCHTTSNKTCLYFHPF